MLLPKETPYIFSSERLGFRLWKQSDVTPFVTMNKDEKVMEFFVRPKTSKESIELVLKMNEFYNKNNYCFFAVDELETTSFIGFIGFWSPEDLPPYSPCVEIGWRLSRFFWNKGFATEGAKACLDFGFNQLKFNEVLSFTSKLNVRSEKVMKKIGMVKFSEFNHPKIDKRHPLAPHIVYKITK